MVLFPSATTFEKKMNIQGHKACMLLGLSITVSKRFGWIVRVKAPGQTMLIKCFLGELCADICW